MLTRIAISLIATPLFLAHPAKAAPAPEPYVVLLTIGPGDAAWARFGHSALMVVQEHQGSKTYDSQVYNYGAADFGRDGFLWEVLRGRGRFMAAKTGTFNQTVNAYAAENRSVTYQKLRLGPKPLGRLLARLEHDLESEHREYTYHHIKAGCSTKIRDLLDYALDGELRRQLSKKRDPLFPRDHGRQALAGLFWAELGAELLLGRIHDQPLTKYDTLYYPQLVSRYLQQVRVPSPTGERGLIPLAEKPRLLVPRQGAEPAEGEGHGRLTRDLFGLLSAISLIWGLAAIWSGRARPRRMGAWLLSWSLPSALIALTITAVALISAIPEMRYNELLLSYWLTDLLLVFVSLRWLFGLPAAGSWLRRYLHLRALALLLVLAGHAAGLLYQQPRIVLLYIAINVGLMELLLLRMGNQAKSITSPS